MIPEESIRRVVPYVAGEQPQEKDIIKLNTNECPYPPAPGVERLMEEMQSGTLRLYPDQNVTSLTDSLARYYGVKPSQVFVGVGSDDVLGMAFLTFFTNGRELLFPDVTYSFYDVWAQLYRIPYRTVPLKDDWHLDADEFCKPGPKAGIIFPNPNAPTGLEEPLSVVERILQANPEVLVIVDEAYVDFGGESALPLVDRYDNLMVVQTFSKSRSMAGLRIGYAIANERLIGYLRDVKFSYNSYTMNRPALELGVEAVRDDEYFKETTAKIIRTRQRAAKEFRELGFSFPESSANFIFVTHRSVPAQEIFHYLRDRRIYVRYWNKPRIQNHLRITIGTDEEMDTLLGTLREMPGIL